MPWSPSDKWAGFFWDLDLDVYMWPKPSSNLLIHLPEQNPDPPPSAPIFWVANSMERENKFT